jgi:hypothetical protein
LWQAPTVLDSQLDDYGAAYPGFLILNPKLLAKISTPVKLWIYSHECGHQFRGPDEETADCFAVQRGRRQKWLTPEGLEEICRFISPAKGESMHFKGAERCEDATRIHRSNSIHRDDRDGAMLDHYRDGSGNGPARPRRNALPSVPEARDHIARKTPSSVVN